MTLLPDWSSHRIELTYNDILPCTIKGGRATRPSDDEERRVERLEIEVDLLWFAASKETFLTGNFVRKVVDAIQTARDEGDYAVGTSPEDRKIALVQGRNGDILSDGIVTRERLAERLYQIVKTNNLSLDQLRK